MATKTEIEYGVQFTLRVSFESFAYTNSEPISKEFTKYFENFEDAHYFYINAERIIDLYDYVSEGFVGSLASIDRLFQVTVIERDIKGERI